MTDRKNPQPIADRDLDTVQGGFYEKGNKAAGIRVVDAPSPRPRILDTMEEGETTGV